MAIKSFNPYSPSRRFITVSAFEEITTDKPYRPLAGKLQRTCLTPSCPAGNGMADGSGRSIP